MVEERVADGEVAVELSEQEGQHVDPEERGQNVEGPVPGRVALLHVEQAEVEDREARQGVADARVEHEDEAVLASQGSGAGDPDQHRAGHQYGAGGEQEVEGEDEEVLRGAEIHRQRDDGGVQEHPDAPTPNRVQDFGFIGCVRGSGGFRRTYRETRGLQRKLVVYRKKTYTDKNISNLT